MCGRFNVLSSAQGFVDLLEILVRIDNRLDNSPRYNIAPTHRVLAVRQSDPDRDAEMSELRWGLIPHWAKDISIGSRLINARSETAATKPSFRNAYKTARCLIAADGWYEWRKLEASKQPYNIRRKDRSPFYFAGLWSSWRGTDRAGKQLNVESCTILTAEAGESLRHIHPRMPVVLGPGLYEQWIDGDIHEVERLDRIVQQRAMLDFEAYPVSTYVNRPVNDSSRCVEAIQTIPEDDT
jgi:putative SOS response-associated peptidase YedK